MYKFNTYTDDHTATETVANIIDAIASMQHAIESGEPLVGQRAIRDHRFTIHDVRAGGIDEFTGYKVYEIAGIEFKVYDRDWSHTDLDVPLFDLSGYPWEGDMVFTKYGRKHDIRALLTVAQMVCERDGMKLSEYVEGVLGWAKEEA